MSNPSSSYDLVVIGGGPGGYVGAFRAAQLGLKVALVEKRERLGGTCLNIGCIPSKALLDSSEHFYHAKTKLDKHGVMVSDVRLDLEKMMKRKDGVVDSLTKGLDALVKKNKVDRFEGIGQVLKPQNGQHSVEILMSKGGDKKTISTKNILLATGSDVVELPQLPFDKKRIISSTEALNLSEVPSHLVVVGGGYIGLEMGSVWARLGSKVTVVEFMDRLLPMCDSQAARELQRALTKQGLEIKLSTKCLSAKVSGGSKPTVTVEIEETGKGTSKIECDYVLVCAGRKPFTEGLGLENAGVSKDAKGRVVIDSHYQTNVPGIYAIGDIVQGPMLAHKAEEEGVAAAEIMTGNPGHVNYNVIPSVIYTWPELASVGKNEEELKAAGINYKAGSVPFMANGRAKAMESTEGFAKILADAQTDKVLGVHIVGPWASDLIAEAASVMEFGGSSEDIARTCHAHPTLSETVREAALAVEKRTLNF
jgi:dihydrolipoamide dehydrogenase